MCPEPRHQSGSRVRGEGQRGFSIVSAIFLLVTLAGLGAAMLTFSNTQHITTAQDLEASRAYQAARAGVEWGLFQALTPGTVPAQAVCNTGALALHGNLSTYSVAVTCTRTDWEEGGNTIYIFEISSTASTGTVGNVDYVERVLQVTASR